MLSACPSPGAGDVLVAYRTSAAGRPAERAAVDRAVLEAATRNRRLCVIGTSARSRPAEQDCSRLESDLDSALRRVDPEGAVAASASVRTGAVGSVLEDASGSGSVLVVAADRRPRWRNALTRSPLGQLLRRSHAPVMLVPAVAGPGQGPFARVVVWVDPAITSPETCEWAQAEAQRYGCPLEVVAALASWPASTEEEPESMRAALRGLRRRLVKFVGAHTVPTEHSPVYASASVNRWTC